MQSVEKLCRENQSLARQIWERIKALLEVFGKSHSEREEIKKAPRNGAFIPRGA
jgi:hypothetical protein